MLFYPHCIEDAKKQISNGNVDAQDLALVTAKLRLGPLDEKFGPCFEFLN